MMATAHEPVEVAAMGIRRAAAALLLSALAVVATATPALAQQTELDASSPGQGATLGAPKLIVLSFTGHVTLPANAITVKGPDGASWDVGQGKATGPLVTAPVEPSGPPGPYTLNYRVIAKDGGAVSGTISFTIVDPDALAAAPPPTATAVPSTGASPGHEVPAHALPGAVPATETKSDSGGIPTWAWILGAVVLLAVGMLEAFRVGRSKRS
jgi:methionine-rich copper-binding protein CopC